MKVLANQTNAPAPDADYPNSRIKDESNPGVGNGVYVNESVWGDSMQFFQKLLIDAGIVANDLFDNVTTGYQTILALEDKIKKTMPTTAAWIVDSLVLSHDALYRKTNLNSVQLDITSLVTLGAGVTIMTLPVGYRPIRQLLVPIDYQYSMIIQTDGVIKAGTNGWATGFGFHAFFEFPLD